MELYKKTALVTGGSRGIGREIAMALARCGADIVINYVGNDDMAHEAAKEIEYMGRKCCLVKTDMKYGTCAEEIYQAVQKVDILVLNASVQYKKKWTDITVEDFDDQINCNLRASLLMIQKFAPYMIGQNWGRIITIGSVQEIKPHPDMLIYAASKTAITMMARSLAPQLGQYGITVNCVAPGVILTDRNVEALSDPQYREKIMEGIPLGRCGETKDCAGIIKLLCSKEGSYITGQNIFVDGGMGLNMR